MNYSLLQFRVATPALLFSCYYSSRVRFHLKKFRGYNCVPLKFEKHWLALQGVSLDILEAKRADAYKFMQCAEPCTHSYFIMLYSYAALIRPSPLPFDMNICITVHVCIHMYIYVCVYIYITSKLIYASPVKLEFP